MKKLTCEMCGSHDIVKQEGMYVCQYCGLKYDTEEAKKLFVEVSGAVKVDNSEKLQNYYTLARRAKENENYEDGARYYDLIRQEEPNSWEANFYSVYFTSMSCVIANIQSAADSLANCLGAVFALIKANVSDPKEVEAAVAEVCGKARGAAHTFGKVSFEEFGAMTYAVQYRFVPDLNGKIFGTVSIYTTMAQKLGKVFGEEKHFVLKEIEAAYGSASWVMIELETALPAANPLEGADIDGIKKRANELQKQYSELGKQYRKKSEAAKAAEIDSIDDVNERFKALLLNNNLNEAVTLYESVTLSKDELRELTTNEKFDLLGSAVMCKNVKGLEMLLAMGADAANHSAWDGGSLIYELAICAQQDVQREAGMQILHMLFDAGVVPKDRDYNDKTDPEIKRVLLSKYPNLKPRVPQPSAESSSGGCYIATAVYGSYDCPEVWTLRRFRDNTLASTWYGRAFIRTYYAISPTLVKLFGDTEWFKKIWRGTLDRMVNTLKTNGIKDTPYADKIW